MQPAREPKQGWITRPPLVVVLVVVLVIEESEKGTDCEDENDEEEDWELSIRIVNELVGRGPAPGDDHRRLTCGEEDEVVGGLPAFRGADGRRIRVVLMDTAHQCLEGEVVGQ